MTSPPPPPPFPPHHNNRISIRSHDAAAAEGATERLVEQWTETDQEIIETLLLVDPPDSQQARAYAYDAAVHRPRPPNHAPVTVGPPLSRSAVPPHLSTDTPPRGETTAHAHWIQQQQHHHDHASNSMGTRRPAYEQLHHSLSHVVVQEEEEEDDDANDTVEERRAKHREVQRRFVQRKKLQMNRVRQEVLALEKRHSFLQLTKEQIQLEKENNSLQDQRVLHSNVAIPTDAQIHGFLENECQVAQKSFRHVTEDHFSELLRETMECVDGTTRTSSQEEPRGKSQDDARIHVMGWTGRRDLEPGSTTNSDNAALRCEICKQFPRVEPEELVDRAWQAVSSPAGYRKFFSPTIIMKITTLQQVNDDAVLIYRTLFNPRTGAVQRSVDLLCRIRTKNEFLIISRAVVVPTVRASLKGRAGWCKSLTVLGFASPPPPPSSSTTNTATTSREKKQYPINSPGTGGQGCAFRYNCSVEGTSEANLKFWLMEILFIGVRFENLLVAPLFVLGPPPPP